MILRLFFTEHGNKKHFDFRNDQKKFGEQQGKLLTITTLLIDTYIFV